MLPILIQSSSFISIVIAAASVLQCWECSYKNLLLRLDSRASGIDEQLHKLESLDPEPQL